MPFRKRYPRKKYKKNAYSMAKRALKVASGLKRQVEYKHVTFDQSIDTISYTGDVTTDCNNTIQGTNDTTRVGDKIFCNSMRLGFRLEKGDVNCNLRVLIFWDKQNTIGGPNDLINSGGTILAPLGQYNVDTRNQWIKLFDKQYVLYDNKPVISFKKSLRIHKQTLYSQGTANIASGRIAMMYISDIPLGQPIGSYPNVKCSQRLYFSDL